MNTKFFLQFSVTLILALSIMLPQPVRAETSTVLYAKPGGLTSGLCESWTNACELQYALTSATSDQEIWAAAGVYKPTSGTDPTATFQFKNGVGLYGGFAGTETSRDQRNWQTNITILSGDIDSNDINNDGNFIAETTADIQGTNSCHIVTGSGTDNTAVLDGFTITAGQANVDNCPNYIGGGMYNNGGNPSLKNVRFSANIASRDGGGIYNDHGSPALTNIIFAVNSAYNNGGGMYNNGGSSTLTNVTFSTNSANHGGGMYNNGSNPTLTNVTFSANSADIGGGMYNYYSNPLIKNAIFSTNSAVTACGGIVNAFGDSTLVNVTFYANLVDPINGYEGGGMCNSRSNSILTNVTFFANSAYYGGGIHNYNSSPTLANCILWGDSASKGPEIYNDGSTLVVRYSDVQGSWPGTGNINSNPLFMDPTIGNLRLKRSSPVINIGNNAAIPAGVTTDLDGKPRILGSKVDMGAYETDVISTRIFSAAAQDGWILESSEASNVGGSLSANAATFFLGDDALDRQYRAILHFVTAGLPDNAVIAKVTLKIKKQSLVGTNPFTTHGKLLIDLRKPYFGATTNLLISDFQAGASKTSAAQFSSIPAGAWYTASFPASSFTFLNKTGTIQLRLRFTKDDNDDLGADYMAFFSGNAATTTDRPILEVNYYVP